MEWSTHMLSGVLAGYVVAGGDLKGALVGGVAGVIPDLDEPKSKFGNVLLPLSIPLNQIFGHRTFTHSLLFAIILSAILMPFFDRWVWLSVLAGVIVHIIGDMLTGKVKLLYPSRKSIGIAIPHYTFTLVDRVTRIILIFISTIMLYDIIIKHF